MQGSPSSQVARATQKPAKALGDRSAVAHEQTSYGVQPVA
jgi:hypothetical protein